MLLSLLLTVSLAPAPAEGLEAFVDQTPACREEAKHCIGIHVHVAPDEAGAPIRSAAWLGERVSEADRHFAAVDVAFQVVAADWLPAEDRIMDTRAHRDAVGADRVTRGVVHLFLVGRLDDVDVPGEQIRGVHWRLRRNVDRRWIIMSQIAMPTVLAHELGHFFGLPHSTYPISIMNKRPRERPPRAERTFHREEKAIMRAQRDQMLRDRTLVEVSSPSGR